MKKQKLIGFVVGIMLPVLVFANIGDDINNIIDKFWGSSEDLEIPVSKNSDFSIDYSNQAQQNFTKNSEFPAQGNPEYIKKIKAEIMSAEDELQNFENEIIKNEAKIENLTEEKNSLETELFILDTQLNSTEQRLKKQQKLIKEWGTLLEDLTRERSEIRTRIRIAEREFAKKMQKIQIRKEAFSDVKEDISLVKWLFSDKTVAEILEAKSRENFELNQYQSFLFKLNQLKIKLQNKEQKTALLLGRFTQLKSSIEKERKLLRNMANGKAKVIASISKTAKEQNRQLNNYRKQQVKSTLYLQDLRQTLLESQNKLLNQDTATNRLNMTKKVLDFPLKIDRQITANFKDKKYKKTFGVDHLGVDFFAPQGTIFYAPADGKIVKTGIHGYGYSYVVVAHANNLSTVYGHISQVFLNVGQTVKAGEAIGKTGGTPGTKGAGYFTTGPHLHFEVWKNRNVVNPLEHLKE